MLVFYPASASHTPFDFHTINAGDFFLYGCVPRLNNLFIKKTARCAENAQPGKITVCGESAMAEIELKTTVHIQR